MNFVKYSIFCQILFCYLASATLAKNVTDENIALHRSYTLSNKPFRNSQGFPPCNEEGDKVQLTDGKLSHNGWFDRLAVMPRSPVDVTIDLGKRYPISKVRVHAMTCKEGYPVNRYPREIYVFVSDSPKGPYRLVGGGQVRKYDDRRSALWGKAYHWFDVPVKKAVGRYVTVRIETDASNAPMDEIEVIKGNFDISTVDMSKYPRLYTTNLRPFTWLKKFEVSRDMVIPFFIYNASQRPKHTDSIYIDVPVEVKFLSVRKHSPIKTIETNGKKFNRYLVKLGKRNYPAVYLRSGSNTPIGWKGKLKLSSLDGKIRQDVELSNIDIPSAPFMRKLFVTVDWTDKFVLWNWPELIPSYKHIGINVLAVLGAQLGGNPQAPDGRWIKLLDEASKAGFYIAANLSPACSFGQYRGFDGIKTAKTPEGNDSPHGCPLDYARAVSRIKGDIIWWPDVHKYQARNPAKNIYYAREIIRYGIRWVWYDSEPGFYPNMCYCDDCKAFFRQFLKKRFRNLKYVDPAKIILENYKLSKVGDVLSRSSVVKYPKQFRAWLDCKAEIGNEIFRAWNNVLQDEMKHKERWFVDKPFPLPLSLQNKLITGEYELDGELKVDGIGWTRNCSRYYDFDVLLGSGTLQQAMPSFYGARAAKIIRVVSTTRRKMAENHYKGLIFCWVTAGMGSRHTEVSPRVYKENLLACYFSGAQGTVAFMCKGTEGRDYKALAQALGLIKPYENLIADGLPIAKDEIKLRKGNVQIGGMKSKDGRLYVLAIASNIPYENSSAIIRLPDNLKNAKAKIIYGLPLTMRQSTIIKLQFTPDNPLTIIEFAI